MFVTVYQFQEFRPTQLMPTAEHTTGHDTDSCF
jgi:hypothetical protein